MRTIAAILFSSLICSLASAQEASQSAAKSATSLSAGNQATPNSMGIVVGRAVIAKGMDENGPVDAGTDFTSDVKRLYCITQIKGANTPVQIEHRWYLNDKLVFSLPLPVNSVNWRTQSYKTILPDMAGSWKVVVMLMPREEVLTTLPFTVK